MTTNDDKVEVEQPWTFDADDNSISLKNCPIFKVYRADDFPCIEDDDRAEADMDYLAHAQVAVMLLNMVANTTEPTVGQAYRTMLARFERDTPTADKGVELERLVEIALHARVPGVAEVWCWLPQKDAWTPHETAHDVMRAAVTAILAALSDAP